MTATFSAGTGSDLRDHLARELHDSVAGELQELLVELELLRRRGGVPDEIEDFGRSVREALARLRHVVRTLRDLPADPGLVQAGIDRKVTASLERGRQPPGPGGRPRMRSARGPDLGPQRRGSPVRREGRR